MKKGKTIAWSISIIISIIITFAFVNITPLYQSVLMGEITSEEYQNWEEYANIYAETLDESHIKKEGYGITKKIQDDHLIVTIIDKYDRGSLIARYPIKIESIDSGKFLIEISSDEVNYERISENNILMFIGLTAIFFFAIFFVFILPITKGIVEERFKKKKEKETEKEVGT